MRQTGSNLPRVGQYNRALVLDQIRLADGISRVELAGLTGLTPQSVSGIVRRLIAEGLVLEDGAGTSRGGKPRMRLRVNASSGRAVGVHFDPAELSAVVVDLLGRPLATLRRPPPPHADGPQLAAAVADLVGTVLERAAVPREEVVGLGLVTPGPIDHGRGLVMTPPQLASWSRVPLKRLVAEATGLPVTLDNDATAAAVGERWAGAGRGVANFAYFFLGTGVGGGLVLGHQVHRGSSMNAAEFGHTTVEPAGGRCYCGNVGCLEMLISPGAIEAEVRRRLAAGEGAGSVLRGAPGLDAVNRAAAAGDAFAGQIVDAAAGYLATVVVNVLNVVDVDLVILGGRGLRHVEERVSRTVERAVRTRPLARDLHTAQVTLSPLARDAAAVGGAALVLYAAYSPQVSSLLSR
ncbi:ROK family transcriptional regulator [Kineosporia succinea]|uniref:NBD/HSP70 family sugar kinase n=1 Tax=Kineosporia succinea TaxID=84632 RepID=A0ABT9P7H7_9ACTN|nr:ROK family transcriptional regulator [Kineosporia succinea]MDP9828407.1 putative NBD/HSP70 family sugar kinase [Kineosporia succinea]